MSQDLIAYFLTPQNLTPSNDVCGSQFLWGNRPQAFIQNSSSTLVLVLNHLPELSMLRYLKLRSADGHAALDGNVQTRIPLDSSSSKRAFSLIR